MVKERAPLLNKNSVCLNLKSIGFKVISTKICFLTLILLVTNLVSSCKETKDRSLSVPKSFNQILVEPKEVRNQKLALHNKGRYVNLYRDGDTLYVIRPFQSIVSVYSWTQRRLITELPIRETQKYGNSIMLIGGSMNDMLKTTEAFYAIENGSAKVVKYDLNWNKIKSYHSDVEFTTDEPGIFEIYNGKLHISIDDVTGRWINKKQELLPNDPLLLTLDLERDVYSPLIIAKDLSKIISSDSIPFFNMTSSPDGFFLTFEFDSKVYHFNKSGQFVSDYDQFTKYTALESFKSEDFRQKLGIFRFFVYPDKIVFFIKRKNKALKLMNFDVMCFNLESSEFWTYTVNQKKGENVRLMHFNNSSELTYLIGRSDSSEIKTLSFSSK